MLVEQFVMAYAVEQDRLRAMLPPEYTSLRPVLRLNAEILDGQRGYVELNTPVERGGLRGWLNIGRWWDVPFTVDGRTTVFQWPLLRISFTGVGVQGSCPAEKDNAGCFFPGEDPELRPAEIISANKEFCDCSFAWRGGAHGVSEGKTLPAYPTPPRTVYPRQALTPENAAAIPCLQVLGTYRVAFAR